MSTLLQRLKLSDTLHLRFKTDAKTFVSKLEAIVGVNKGIRSFKASPEEFTGIVHHNGFVIQRRRRFFEQRLVRPELKGSFTPGDGVLDIQVEINGFSGVVVLFFCMLLVFYTIFFVSVFFIPNAPDGFPVKYVLIPALLLHAALMIVVPYLYLRRSVERAKYHFERELFFLTKV